LLLCDSAEPTSFFISRRSTRLVAQTFASDSPDTQRIDFQEPIMSLSSPEQIAAAQKSNRDTSWALANTVFEGFQKLVELNLQAVKSTLAEGRDNVGKALPANDPQDLVALQGRLIQPTAEKIQSYSRQVFAIVAATQTQLSKLVEAQYQAHNQRVQTLVDNVAQSAPAGSEAAVAALKSTITATNGLYETGQRTTRHAVEVAESNFETVVAAASKATQHSGEQASRSAKKS
jgi:phasin family protein